MDKTLIKVIKILLDEIEQQADMQERLGALEQWQEQIEAEWEKVNGTD